MKIACSNEAFELWYYLHFHYLDAGISRVDYITRLNDELPFPYEKNSRDLYDYLFTRQPTAIKLAKRLLKNYAIHDPSVHKPSTTVHLLVEELNRYLMGGS